MKKIIVILVGILVLCGCSNQKMDKYDMLDEIAMDFVNGDITYSELCDEYDLIEEMFADEEGYN